MCEEIKVEKFRCADCGKIVKVNNFEDIIKYEKKCADCRLIDVTGGLKEKKTIASKPKKIFDNKHTTNDSLKREIPRKKCKKKQTKNQSRKAMSERLGYYTM